MKIRAGKTPLPPKPEPEPIVYEQVECVVCHAPTDKPAVWTCRCRAYRTCYRSPCVLSVPVEHRDGECRPMTEADMLLADVRSKGFAFRVDDKGQLVVSPASKLSREQRAALKVHKDELLAILAWEAAEPPASDATLRAWYKTLEKNNP